LLHLVGLTRHFILRMHGHTNINKYYSLCVLYNFLFIFSDMFAWWWLLYAAETCSCYWIYCNKVCMSTECVIIITCCYLRFSIRHITLAWRCAGNWDENPVVLTWELHVSRCHLHTSPTFFSWVKKLSVIGWAPEWSWPYDEEKITNNSTWSRTLTAQVRIM